MKKRILFVEDDRPVLDLIMARLEHEGFEVVPATDGEACLKCVMDGNGVDLVLLDLCLPKLNGYQVCKRLRAQPATAKIPIIIFSGSETAISGVTDRCIELGVQELLQKPLQSKELLAAIHKALEEEGTRHV